MPELPPDLVRALSDRYRIERELGEGGMATVYLAEDLKQNRRVALGVLDVETVGGGPYIGIDPQPDRGASEAGREPRPAPYEIPEERP